MKLIIIILSLIVFYVYCYFIYPTHVSILQTSLEDFDFNMLLNRQPLVIEDKIKDVKYVLSAWFSGNIIQDTSFDSKRIWNINSHKYMYLYSIRDTEILLYPAGNTVINDVPDNREPVLAIQLKKTQSIVIPYRWYYNIKNKDDVKLYGIHDYVTYFVDFLI
jgi:hypothetical protein